MKRFKRMPLGATACFEGGSEGGDSEPSGEDLGAEDSEDDDDDEEEAASDDDDVRSRGSTATVDSTSYQADAVLPPVHRCMRMVFKGRYDDDGVEQEDICGEARSENSQICHACEQETMWA